MWLVFRIRADAKDSSIPLGSKFGCEPEQANEVIEAVAKLGLNLIGISFHVGTGCKEPEAYPRAINTAISLFPIVRKHGLNLSLLDIGGGFPGDSADDFYKVSRLITEVLDENKQELNNLTLIAEPGRYFVTSAYKLVTTIIGVRNVPSKVIYTVNESIFGLFNCIWTEHVFKIPEQLYKSNGEVKPSAIWGNTPSIHDRLADDCLLPELKIGEWVIFENMGAYSICLFTKFQSSTPPRMFYMVTDSTWKLINN